jgi:hypothetical protein
MVNLTRERARRYVLGFGLHTKRSRTNSRLNRIWISYRERVIMRI